MKRLQTPISPGLWQALENHAERTHEPLSHIVTRALADYLQVSHNTLYQVSTSTALVEGIYQGAVRVGTLREHGDLGLGTFENLDGEMVMVDGRVFQVRADGSVHECDDAARGIGLDRLRQQAVEREWFVVAARHQTFDHVTPDLLQRDAFDDEGIEAVEAAEHAFHQSAPLRRVRIDVSEVIETGRVGGRTMHRDRRLGALAHRRAQQYERGDQSGSPQRARPKDARA